MARRWSRLLEPPRLRTLAEEVEDDRRATWLELFFDLVFVVAVAQASFLLTDHLSAGRFLGYLGVFVAIWWSWMGFTFYANRFDTDDLPYRLLVFVAMLAIAALAVNTRHALGGSSAGFALSYVCVRIVLLVLYARARRHVERTRRLTTIFLCFFGTAVLVWLGSLLVDRPWRFWLWGLALALELTAPLFAWRSMPQAPIHPRHIPERFGLLTIIVLGESVFAVVGATTHVSWHASAILASLAGFLSAAALWWIYFEFLDETIVERGLASGLVFTYAHYLVIVGLASLGTGVKLAILSTGPGAAYHDAGWVLSAGAAICMLGFTAIQLATPPTLFDADVWLRLGTAVIAIALAAATKVLSPVAALGVLAAALVAQVIFELAEHEEHHGRVGPVG